MIFNRDSACVELAGARAYQPGMLALYRDPRDFEWVSGRLWGGAQPLVGRPNLDSRGNKKRTMPIPPSRWTMRRENARRISRSSCRAWSVATGMEVWLIGWLAAAMLAERGGLYAVITP